MQIPEIVDEIIKKLHEHGHEAFVVGGCVRDVMLGREPEDWDVTTSAFPEQVKALFRRTIDTGVQHGTVTVMYGKKGYEVTTYRIDGEYEDARHPKEVSFTSDLLEDLKRRDFTINAMAYSHESGIVDVFNGKADLENGVIRCVGDPMERFLEDALRILRAIRFSAQLGFKIEPQTWEAVKMLAPNIARVSKERIQMELSKLLLSERPELIDLVFESGISEFISPAFAQIPRGQIMVCNQLKEIKALRWAAFLCVIPSKDAVWILKDLKFDNDTIRIVETLVRWCNTEIEATAVSVRRVMSQMDSEVWDLLLDLKALLNPPEIMISLREITKEIRGSGNCLNLSQLAVNGQDLIEIGIPAGVQVGKTLKRLLERVLVNPDDNQKEILLKIAEHLTD